MYTNIKALILHFTPDLYDETGVHFVGRGDKQGGRGFRAVVVALRRRNPRRGSGRVRPGEGYRGFPLRVPDSAREA